MTIYAKTKSPITKNQWILIPHQILSRNDTLEYFLGHFLSVFEKVRIMWYYHTAGPAVVEITPHECSTQINHECVPAGAHARVIDLGGTRVWCNFHDS